MKSAIEQAGKSNAITILWRDAGSDDLCRHMHGAYMMLSDDNWEMREEVFFLEQIAYRLCHMSLTEKWAVAS